VSKQFWTFLIIGLAVVGIGIFFLLFSTKSNHLELDGKILKVRILSLNPNASIVVVDFRENNPSDVGFLVKTVLMKLDPASGDAAEGTPISKFDVENVFKYEKLLGPKYNDVLSIRDKIAPHQTVDRMVGARFELGESAIEARKDIRLQIEDMDGTVAELIEKK
jgi:hypothetical protein